jgi:hypothetical protein
MAPAGRGITLPVGFEVPEHAILPISGRVTVRSREGWDNPRRDKDRKVLRTIAPPILLRLALHGCARRVLALEPVGRAAGAVGRGLALRHDALQAHLAGVAEHGRPVGLDVLVHAQAWGSLGEHGGERSCIVDGEAVCSATTQAELPPHDLTSRFVLIAAVESRTRSPSLRAITRKQSCLISCSHASPVGARAGRHPELRKFKSMGRYKWVYHDNARHNPNGYPEDIVRTAVLAADTRRHERRSAAAKLKQIPVKVVHSLHAESTPYIRLCGGLE